jgi:hypothetical protein
LVFGTNFPIFKNGDTFECQNYRGITLLNVIYEILPTIIVKKLNEYSEKILSEYQCGFRPKRSIIDQIFVVRQTLEKCSEYSVDIHMLILDFMQVFDSVSRRTLYDALLNSGTPVKLINLIQMTMSQTIGKVLVGNQASRAIQMRSGVRQGDALPAALFNLTMHSAIQKVEPSGTIVNMTTQLLGYADDIALMGRNPIALKEIFSELAKGAKILGLKINENKTKYLIISNLQARKEPGTCPLVNMILKVLERYPTLERI